MRLLMVAPPGAGKGTQAARLAKHYGIAHLSSGELFRSEVEGKTEIGQRVADYLRRGDLVPDDVVLQVIAGPVIQAASEGGYVLDGFPRTLRQAEEAYEMAHQLEGVELQAVVHLEVSRQELLRRLLARAEAEKRGDDEAAVIRHRLEVYDTETAPMLDFYGKRGLVLDIDGERPVEKVFESTVAAIDSLQEAMR